MIHPLFFALTVLGAAGSLRAQDANGSTVGQEVQTSSGLVKGHAAPWPADSQVSEYIGIPYAEPPLGSLRFAAPKAFKSDKPFTADEYSADCMQYVAAASSTMPESDPALFAYGEGMGGGSPDAPHTYSEDCLGINVWTKPQTGEAAKAVLVWIYGGGFSTGTSNAPFYNGARLADEEDVVVVNFNYRINIFGFPLAPGLPDANVGLLDQRLAIEWVRDNIAAFGGDPERITLFGESAGGFSVDYYAYAWTDDPIVNGFIAQSGTALGGIPPSTEEPWFNVSSTLGCGGAEVGSEQTVDCMREKPAEDIMDAVGKLAEGTPITPFSPVPDGKTMFADVRNRAEAGDFIPRPMLVGNTDNELGITEVMGGALGDLGGGGEDNSMGDDLDPGLISAFGNAVAFTCPAGDAADARVNAGVNAWRYRYMGVWKNTALAPGIGAYHSSEIPLVFGTNGLRRDAAEDTPEQAELTQIMMHAWAEFARDPENGLTGLSWPVYDPEGPTLIRLGYQNKSEPNFGLGGEYDSLCAIAGGLGGS